MTASELIKKLREMPPDERLVLRVQFEGTDFKRCVMTHSVFVGGKFVCSWKVPENDSR